MIEVTLSTVLRLRRELEHAAMNYPADIFELAKEEYLQKLKIYTDEHTGEEQFERFQVSEQDRTERLAEFNRSGSGYVSKGNNSQVRSRATSDGSESSNLRSSGGKR